MLTELQFIQLQYDKAKNEINNLDTQYTIDTSVYNAKRRVVEKNMDLFNLRLNELETAAKIKSEQEKENENE